MINTSLLLTAARPQLAAPPAAPPAALPNELTERESQTLALIVNGCNNKQIARELGISDGTVKIYVRNLLRKFRLNSRLELATWVHRSDVQQQPLEEPNARLNQAQNSALGFGGLIDELPGLIYRGDNQRNWPMQYVSAGCKDLTGYSPDYLSNNPEHHYGALILAEYVDYIWYCVQCALLRNEPYQLSYRIRCADGQIKDVWEKGVGIYSASGEVLGVEGAIFEMRG